MFCCRENNESDWKHVNAQRMPRAVDPSGLLRSEHMRKIRKSQRRNKGGRARYESREMLCQRSQGPTPDPAERAHAWLSFANHFAPPPM